MPIGGKFSYWSLRFTKTSTSSVGVEAWSTLSFKELEVSLPRFPDVGVNSWIRLLRLNILYSHFEANVTFLYKIKQKISSPPWQVDYKKRRTMILMFLSNLLA